MIYLLWRAVRRSCRRRSRCPPLQRHIPAHLQSTAGQVKERMRYERDLLHKQVNEMKMTIESEYQFDSLDETILPIHRTMKEEQFIEEILYLWCQHRRRSARPQISPRSDCYTRWDKKPNRIKIGQEETRVMENKKDGRSTQHQKHHDKRIRDVT